MQKRRFPYFDGPLPLGFAHRGGAALWPENTLIAFRGALGLGITHLETDVHLTRDGHVVVFHDARLDRTTDARGFIRDRSLVELGRVDAGHRFSADGRTYPWRGRGLGIPTLSQLVELTPSAFLNLELKQAGVGLPLAVWRLIEKYEIHSRVLVASARYDLVSEFRRLSRGSVATSASEREVLAFWLAVQARTSDWLPIGYQALQVPPRAGRLTVIDRRFVERAHRRGLHVHAWTINEPTEMRGLLELGVDGLMSDRPDLLLAEINAHRSGAR